MKLLNAIAKFKALLGAVKLTQEPLVNGSLIQYDTVEIEMGAPVFLVDGASDWALLPDGLYQTKSQMHFTVTDGVVSNIDKNGMIKPAEKPGPTLQAIDQSETNMETPVVVEPVVVVEQSEIVNPPAGGAPDVLVNPDLINASDSYSTCMQRLNELHAQHSSLLGFHNQLRTEHDAANAKINEMIGKHNALAVKCDEMMSKLSNSENDKLKMSKQIEFLSKQPAGQPIEEIKTGGFTNVDPKVAESKAFKILNGTN